MVTRPCASVTGCCAKSTLGRSVFHSGGLLQRAGKQDRIVSLRSEAEKWRVPESDPAGDKDSGRLSVPRTSGDSLPGENAEDRGLLIFCGMCGALNPSNSFYCAACGSTLVDAFHASEGLRIFERPDAASRIVGIVSSGTELDVHEDPGAPSDYVRVRLSDGRMGYIRLAEVSAHATVPHPANVAGTPDINIHARGCVSPFAALTSLLLLILLSSGTLYLLGQEDSGDAGFLSLVTCLIVAPFALLMIVLYLMARDREDRLIEDETADEATIES